MPQAVEMYVPAQRPTVKSPINSTKSQTTDGESFQSALDQARNSEPPAKPGASRTSAATKEKAKPAKAAGKGAAAKHARGKTDTPKDPADATSALADDSETATAPEDPAQQNAPADDSTDVPKDAKAQKDEPAAQQAVATVVDPATLAASQRAVAKPVNQPAPKGTKEAPVTAPKAPAVNPATAKAVVNSKDPINAANAGQIDATAAPSATDATENTQTPDSTPAVRPAAIPLNGLADPTANATGIQPRNAKAQTTTDDPSAATGATDPGSLSASLAALGAWNLPGQRTDALTTDAGSASVSASSPIARLAEKSTDDAAGLLAASQNTPGSVKQSASEPFTVTSNDPLPPPEAQFAQANHPHIVSGIAGRLLPNGGTMQLRLDPPELGVMNVRVEMRDGVVSASFETSSDQTSKLLSHSLGDLKSALEAQGVSVEKLHVTQTPKQQQSSSGENGKQDAGGQQDNPAQQEKQRKEMMQRMWRRLMNGSDPLDLVA